jgi:hypothetical protein
MKGIPILILLAFFAGAVIGDGLGSLDEPVTPVDRGPSPITFKNVAAQNLLAQEPVETQVFMPAHGANEVASQRLSQLNGIHNSGIPQVHSGNHSPTNQSLLDRPQGRTVGHLSELVGSSQQRAQFEAAQMLHPELEKLDPLDLYFDDVSWPY